MIKAFHYRRLLLLGSVLLAGLGWLTFNLWRIQIGRHSELAAKAEGVYAFTRSAAPIRGEIRDSRNRALALNEPVKSIFVNPWLLGQHREQMAQLLAFWLQTNAACVAGQIKPRILGLDSHQQPIGNTRVRLKSRVSPEEWWRLKRLLLGYDFGFGSATLTRKQQSELQKLRTRAVFVDDDQVRRYPNHTLAAHVVGHLNALDQAEAPEGRCGIEAACDQYLRGSPGLRRGEWNVHGEEIYCWRRWDQKPVDGWNVVLTINGDLQRILEAELARAMRDFHAAGAKGLMVEPRTGRILALASLPAFDPEDLRHAPSEAWRNKAIADVYEPGSTFKIVVYSALLDQGLATLDTLVDCGHGRFDYPGAPLWESSSLGVVPCVTALAHSSSVAAARLGLLVGRERLYRYILAFGFGNKTHVGLPSEREGEVHPWGKWSGATLTRVPIGYGVAITPIQLVMAMSAIANEGRLMKPMIVERLEDRQGRVGAQAVPVFVRQVMNPVTARQMVRGLKAVVSLSGTGRLAALDGISTAGKTGTARVAFEHGPRGYQPSKYRASFCGFFPADTPAVCVLVVLDDPQPEHTGGHTAAPTFRHISTQVARYLRLAPEGPALASLSVRSHR